MATITDKGLTEFARLFRKNQEEDPKPDPEKENFVHTFTITGPWARWSRHMKRDLTGRPRTILRARVRLRNPIKEIGLFNRQTTGKLIARHVFTPEEQEKFREGEPVTITFNL